MSPWPVAALSLALAGAAAAECRQALALGLDVSGSVDRTEYDLQLNGLAQALLAPVVIEAFLAYPEAPVDLYVYEWSGFDRQTAILPWTTIASRDDLAAAARLLTAPGFRPREAATGLGHGMLFGARALAERAGCWRRTLDISGDGKSNNGPSPREVQGDPVLAGLTINGLVVGVAAPLMAGARADSIPELSAYFRAEVIRGPDAFIQVALGYADYQTAMEKKLLKELQTLPIGDLAPGPDRREALAGN
jgi:hypothetical protein